MAISNKLCNPTPFRAKIQYEKGVEIHIPAYGETELTVQQMDDFREGKPGSEETKRVLDFNGLFLYDLQLPYDVQALQAIRRCISEKKILLDQSVEVIKSRGNALGQPVTEEQLEEHLRLRNLTPIRDQILTLQEQEKHLAAITQSQTARSGVTKQYDPKRTIFVVDPPREFPTEAMMHWFLNRPENSGIKKQHFEMMAEMDNETKTAR